eukprot:TRINITY_DN3808_c1_g2_i1.p2 TRINITY_DN3808_c1_g2~~TRINITY_DN3808_c1_g2_i1.p2  ORF type:complete len:170 (-),score=56.05 TRINITY_DN3808_c1_g2_i1:114-623(-)
MKPDWDKLMKKYEGHASILIADVDCTADGKSLCDSVGIEGFPTIKYGDPSNLEDYEGERDFDGLQAHAEKELGPRCSPANLDLCDADKKKQIEDFLAMSGDTLVSAIQAKEDELAEATKKHEEFVESLQKQYEESEKAMKDKKDEIKESGLGLMKAVKAHRKNVNKEEL